MKDLYQPVLFDGYDDLDVVRDDCLQRYEMMRPYMMGKSLLDLCCSNGYFGFKFLQDGGKKVVGVEENEEICAFVNKMALDNRMNFECVRSIAEVFGKFDIGIYLDTHYHPSTEGYLEFICGKVKQLFASCSRGHRNLEFKKDLSRYFKNVMEIYLGRHSRAIFLCE